jgi:hypothetical protein
MSPPPKRSIAGAVILISVGVLFLAHNLTSFDLMHIIWRYWPLILIVLGITKLLEYYRTSQQPNLKQ